MEYQGIYRGSQGRNERRLGDPIEEHLGGVNRLDGALATLSHVVCNDEEGSGYEGKMASQV